MKILHSLEGTSWSGGQQQTLFLAEGQARLGHDVLVMCQKNGELEKRAKTAGLRVSSLDYRCEMNPLAIYRLLRAFEDFKPDIVNVHRSWAHTQWVFVSLMKRFSGLVVSRRVLFKPDFNPLSYVKYRSSAIKRFIAVSDAVAGRLREIGVGAGKIRVVYPASDSNKFDPSVQTCLDGNWPVEPDMPVALMVGNYSRNKGHCLLIEAFAGVRDQWPALQLVLAGHNTDSAELYDMVKRYKLTERVHLLGFRKDVPAMMQRSSFTINASYQEGFSGSVRESLLMGVPVIASDIPSNLEIGRLVPLSLFACGQKDSLTRRILEQRSHANAGKNDAVLRGLAVKSFSVDSMIKKTMAVYDEICS